MDKTRNSRLKLNRFPDRGPSPLNRGLGIGVGRENRPESLRKSGEKWKIKNVYYGPEPSMEKPKEAWLPQA